MDDGTCYCKPFYTGSSCETFSDCPPNLDKNICIELKNSNNIDTTNLSNDDKNKTNVNSSDNNIVSNDNDNSKSVESDNTDNNKNLRPSIIQVIDKNEDNFFRSDNDTIMANTTNYCINSKDGKKYIVINKKIIL